MNLCDGDCEHAAKLQELQQLVAGMAHHRVTLDDVRVRADEDEWYCVLELLDIPTF